MEKKDQDQFDDELKELLEKWRGKDLPNSEFFSNSELRCHRLLIEAKKEAVVAYDDYYQMLGELTDLLYENLNEMFYFVRDKIDDETNQK